LQLTLVQTGYNQPDVDAQVCTGTVNAIKDNETKEKLLQAGRP